MSLPRLAEAGDSALLHITKCVPVESDTIGPAVEFTGATSADVLTLPRKGVDAALRTMGFCFGEKRGDDSIIDYAGAVGEWILFQRTPNANGGRPLWKITKASAPDLSPEKPAPVAPARTQTPATVQPPAPPRAPSAVMSTGRERGELPELSPEVAAAKRQAIREAHKREIEYVVSEIVPMLRKKKIPVDFSVNALANNLVMDMSKKRCL